MAAEVEHQDLTVDEARAFVRHVRASVEEIGNWIVRAVTGRAWIALGYASWDAMCEAEFDGAVIRLPREDRREAVASLREAGLSTRAIAGALGVSNSTVHADLDRSESNSPPTTVTSLDGRSRPATQPQTKTVRIVDTKTGEISEESYASPEHVVNARRDQTAEMFVRDYPELAYYLDQGRINDVIRLGNAVHGYDEPERSMRRKNLRKAIAADKRRDRAPTVPSRDPDWAALAERMFFAANEAAQVIARSGGPDTFTHVLAADPIEAQNWHDQFTELAATCTQIADACRPKLRRVK